jgi:hypothetical protein
MLASTQTLDLQSALHAEQENFLYLVHPIARHARLVLGHIPNIQRVHYVHQGLILKM